MDRTWASYVACRHAHVTAGGHLPSTCAHCEAQAALTIGTPVERLRARRAALQAARTGLRAAVAGGVHGALLGQGSTQAGAA